MPPFAVTKTAPPPAARAEAEERRLRQGSREPSPVRIAGREGGKSDQGLAAGVGASRGSVREARGATLALFLLHPGLQHPRPEKSLAPPGGCEPAGSAALVSHKKRKKKKKWVRQMQRGKSIGIREKREESRSSHSGLTGSQLARHKKKKKKPGREREWRRVCVAGGSGVKGGTGEIYYCLWQPPREPGRGAEARGGGGCGQRTIRST